MAVFFARGEGLHRRIADLRGDLVGLRLSPPDGFDIGELLEVPIGETEFECRPAGIGMPSRLYLPVRVIRCGNKDRSSSRP